MVFLMGTGLCTLFLPILTTDTAVRGRSRWAPLDLLVAHADQWQPTPLLFHVHVVLYQIASLYVLMALAILVLALPWPHQPLKLIAVVGSAISISLLGRQGARGFGWLFYGRVTHSRIFDGDTSWRGAILGWEGLHFGAAYFVLIGVMPLLAVALISSERLALPPGGSGQYDSDITQR